jgi:hypothetical protein
MRINKLIHLLILTSISLISSSFLFSYENEEFEFFFDAQVERELEKIQQKEAIVTQFSKKYILTFFYVGDQEASNHAAKHVQDLALKYNWQTYAISLDSIFITGFENNKINNGIYTEFQTRSNAPYKDFFGPSLFLFNPQNKTIRWVLTGSTAFNELEDQIYLRYQYFGL